jgi:hypothetical protein
MRRRNIFAKMPINFGAAGTTIMTKASLAITAFILTVAGMTAAPTAEAAYASGEGRLDDLSRSRRS